MSLSEFNKCFAHACCMYTFFFRFSKKMHIVFYQYFH
jgi:hypothetical protein